MIVSVCNTISCLWSQKQPRFIVTCSSTGDFIIKTNTITCNQREEKGKCLKLILTKENEKYNTVVVAVQKNIIDFCKALMTTA